MCILRKNLVLFSLVRTRTCIGITTLCTIIVADVILGIIFTVGIKNGNHSNAVIANPDDPINGGGLAGNGTFSSSSSSSSISSGPFINSSTGINGGGEIPTATPTTQSPTTATPTPTPIPTSFIPAAPLANDRCTQAFPQSTINPWVSTATCDQCTTAGCGWCTIPIKQSDGSTRYYTSCREKNAAGTADIGGVCDANTIPDAFKAFPSGKSTVFANAPSSATVGLTCRAAELAEHPSTPAYPPTNDTCHTLLNARSCSACIDYTNNAFTITTASTTTCGWLTLPITIDGVTRWYTSCRRATLAQTNTARNTPANLLTLPANKTKIWAQNPIGAKLLNTIGSCRESALADAPYTAAPYLGPPADVCSSKTTCGECGATSACGWCSIPSISTNGTVTVVTSRRAGTSTGSLDGACTLRDPRVPAIIFIEHGSKIQHVHHPSHKMLPHLRVIISIIHQLWRRGRCVPTYTSYGGPTTGIKSPTSGTQIDYSPSCATPDTALNWVSCP